MKQINFLLLKISSILIFTYSINGYSQHVLHTTCGQDFHGVGLAHQDCNQDIVVTSTEHEGTEGTIFAGVIHSEGSIRIIPGYSRVRIVHELDHSNPETHITKVGGNGTNPGGFGRPLNLNEIFMPIVSIAPNPTKSIITLSSTPHKIEQYSIYNFYGVMVKQETIKPSTTYSCNLQHLKKGIYLLKLQLENGEQITKTIAKN